MEDPSDKSRLSQQHTRSSDVERPTLARTDPGTSLLSVTCYRISTPSQANIKQPKTTLLEEVSLAHALNQKRHDNHGDIGGGGDKGKSSFWIDADIQGEGIDDGLNRLYELALRPLLANEKTLNGAPPFLQRHLRHVPQYQTTQVLPLPQAIFCVMRTLHRKENTLFSESRKKSTSSLSLCHAAALVLQQGVLVTVTSSSYMSTLKEQIKEGQDDDVDEGDESDPSNKPVARSHLLTEASTTGALVLWLQTHLQRSYRATHELRSIVIKLVEEIAQDQTSVPIAKISQCQDTFMRLSAVAEEQHECVQALAVANDLCEAIQLDAVRASVTVLLSTAGTTERLLIRIEKRLQDLRHAYESHQQERINHRLNVLTVFSAIFLPLTLMAGIYGMNFQNMPELQREHAYHVFLACLGVVATIMLGGFYRQGWFDS